MASNDVKRQIFERFLALGTTAIHFDPRCEGVVVPAEFRRQPRLVLDYGFDMAVPIDDLEADDKGISATLSFNRTPYGTFVPWETVFAVTDERGGGLVFKDHLPPELRGPARTTDGNAAMQTDPDDAVLAAAEPTEAPKKGKKRHLRLVAANEVPPADLPPPPPRTDSPILRLLDGGFFSNKEGEA